jgi:hypothetical protein
MQNRRRAADEPTKEVLTDESGYVNGFEERPDYQASGAFYKLGAKLLATYSANWTINAEVPVEELLVEFEGGFDPAK